MHLLLKAKLEQNNKTAGNHGNIMFRYCTKKMLKAVQSVIILCFVKIKFPHKENITNVFTLKQWPCSL